MNQIISQHGWGLDKSLWDNIKKEFLKNNWYWQDSERGYFKYNSKNPKWKENQSKTTIKMAICHSLGTHLIDPNILHEASHIVLINSFNNFVPNNDRRNYTIKLLQKMETKICAAKINQLINEFLIRSFLPNEINNEFKKKFEDNSMEIKIPQLLKDFKKLYIENKNKKLFTQNAEILIIKSRNDHIINESSSNDFINLLRKEQTKIPKVIDIDNQGHILSEVNIFKIIINWIEPNYVK